MASNILWCVRGPVHHISSLLEEEVDLTPYASVLCSCSAIVRKMKEIGKLTASEEARALDYLKLRERPWAGEPEITEGSALFLDDIAVTYFQHLGLLDKLKPAGFYPIVPPSSVAEANALISYSQTATQVQAGIENIRTIVSRCVASGKVKLGRQFRFEPDEVNILAHPSVDILPLAVTTDVAIADDRFF